MNEKFHINKNGDVKECRADVRACRFGDAQHFADEATAWKAAEAQNKADNPDELGTVTKNPVGTKRDVLKLDEKFKTLIKDLSSREEMTPDQIQEIGAVFEEELERRLPFNPWDHELSTEEFEEIKKMNRSIYSALVKNDEDMPVKATGPLSEALNKVVKILPTSVKNKVPELNTTYLNSNTTRRWGQFRHLKEFSTPEPKYASYFFENGMADGAPNDVLIPGWNGSLANLEREGYSGEVYMKREGEYKLEEFWIGKKPSSRGYKKVSNTTEIFSEGKMRTINKPLYKVYSMVKIYKSEIAVTQDFSTDSDNMDTILLHEYCHAVQHADKLDVADQELEMFDTIASEKPITSRLGTRYTGFPDRYMGLASNYELFTVASEGFFLPDAEHKDFFYGTTQGTNAKQVRQWIAGIWLALGNNE